MSGLFLCSKCLLGKPEEEFDKDAKNKIISCCKPCKMMKNDQNTFLIQKSKEYRMNNKEKIREMKMIYYDKNKESILQKKKDYYQQNKDVIKERRLLRYNNSKTDLKNGLKMV